MTLFGSFAQRLIRPHSLLLVFLCAGATAHAQEQRSFTITPASPVAFEPLQMSFGITQSCENVASFKPIAGGFRVEIAGDTGQIFCDDGVQHVVSIGAYPPGTYRIELGRTAAFGGATLGTMDLVVRPGSIATSRFEGGGEDFSGLWFSPADERSSGMTFIHTPAGPNPTGARSNLIGIWYRYGADGSPRWYWVEAPSNQARDFNAATVFVYDETNPTAPPSQRTIRATSVGTLNITFPTSGPARVTGTLEGEPVDFRLERFRWSRAAWPQTP